MSNETKINDEYYPMLIGDILLHSERRLNPILVISQPLINRSFQPTNGISKNSSIPINITRIGNKSNGILCDLKNTTTVQSTYERRRSFKKFIRLHQVGWSFIKRVKLRVIKIPNHQVNLSSKNSKQTIF